MNATCPNCGKPVPPSALEGLCPECMLRVGAAAHTEAPDETGPHRTRVVPSPPLNPEEIAQRFPQLEILECLGRGGMGVVYKARQPRLDRLVALKILAPEKEQQPEFAERFAREAKALARLNHPNIVTVHDFGEAEGLYYLLMEFVDGMTLRQLLQRQKLAPEEALNIVPKICEALQFAHEQGVVHRDIKPENVLLDKQGRVKIADFGIAKLVAGGDGSPRCAGEPERTAGPGVPTNSLTQDQVVGTPHYMAPEQVEKPQLVDHRADIYSLGVVFYEMLTGELPLGKFQPPSKKVQVDVRLDEVVLHALEKEPDRRYQHASEVKTAVETIAATPAAPAAAATPAGPPGSAPQAKPGSTQPVSRSIPGWMFLLGSCWLLLAIVVLLGKKVARTEPLMYAFFGLGGWRYPDSYNAVIVLSVVLGLGCLWLGWMGGRGGVAWLVRRLSLGLLGASPWLVVMFALVLGKKAVRWEPTLYAFFGVGGWMYPSSYNWLIGGCLLLAMATFGVIWVGAQEHPEARLAESDADQTAAGRGLPAAGGPGAAPPVLIKRWRDAWLWNWEYIQLFLIVPLVVVALALPFGLKWWGLKALWLFALEWPGIAFAITYAIVGRRVRQTQAAIPRSRGEMAECLMFRRPFLSPGLAVMQVDRLELIPIVGSPISVPLADIVAIKEVWWFNGTWLWFKKGFVMDLANGQRVGVAVAEVFARRWRAKLSRGSLPEIPTDSDSVEDRATMVARQQVRAPAAAMLIAVVLNYLLLVSLSASLATGVPRLPFALVAGAVTALVVVGAVQMWRGKAYGLAVVASILMMIIPLACILGLPLGIWALVVLRRREVRELFGKSYPLSPPESPARSRGGAAWKVAVAALAAVLLVLAIPVGALLLKIGIVSFHKAGKPAQAIAATQNSPPATAPAVSAGPVVEQGLSSAATQRPIKAEDLDTPSSAAQPGQVLVSRAEPGTFKLTLTNGVSVEVVAVVRNPLRNKLWWKPDGTPLPQPPGARVIFRPAGMWKERDVNEEAHALLVRCDLPSGTADRHWQYGLEHRPRGERLGSLQIQQGSQMEQAAEELERLGRKIVGGAGGPKLSSQVVGYAEVVRFPAGTKEVALQCRSAVGPWEPVAVFDGKQTKVAIEGVRVLCTYLRQEPNGKCLDVTHDVDRGLYALRMMGVFKGGRREELVFHSGVLGGRETQGFVLLEPGQRVENIVEFVLERTPWVNGRIEGIRLEPRVPSATLE